MPLLGIHDPVEPTSLKGIGSVLEDGVHLLLLLLAGLELLLLDGLLGLVVQALHVADGPLQELAVFVLH